MTHITQSLPDGTTVLAKAYAHARKLFELSPARAGAMTYGLGNIGEQSIEGLVREFRSEIAATSTINEIAEALFGYIEPRWSEARGRC